MCKLGHLDVISLLANIGFRIQHTKLPLIKVSNPFLHKMPVLVNFSDFFPDYIAKFKHLTQPNDDDDAGVMIPL